MTLDAITALLRAEYGITASLTRLAGENENYRVDANNGRTYVLKLADDQTSTQMIEIEYLACERLRQAKIDFGLPRVIPTLDGKVEAGLDIPGPEGGRVRARLLAFVEGEAWCRALPASGEQLRDLGAAIARMNLAMAPIIHPATSRTHHWDLAAADRHRPDIALIRDPEQAAVLEQVFLWFDSLVKPVLDQLPRGLIHGDLNDDNILVTRGRVAGILDFGDCLDNPLVCDLAIALAYHTLDEAAPLEAAAVITGAYHEVRPLEPAELEVLFPLVCARLAVSVLISAKRRQINPERASWFVSEARAWKNLALFAGIPPVQAARTLAAHTGIELFPDQGEPPEKLAEQRQSCIAPCLSLSYATPLKMVRARAQFLFDFHGRPFLDLYNNVCHVGHCHPRVVAAGQAQMARLNTNTRYLYDGLTQYARALTATLPKELDTCFFVNSGSEANELALRMARTVTGRQDVLVVDNAYHGHTQAMIHISPYKFMGKGGKGMAEPWVHMVPVADGYRGRYKGQSDDAGRAYGDEVSRIIDQAGRPVAAFITESLLSCGGQVIPPAGYFKTAFDHVRKAGGLCICDEVQTGFGRTGSHFWAFERQNVVPDIMVMGKPMGNGHPMAAVVTRADIAEAFANGMEFFATFGGNPVSCAIGQAVLDVIQDEALQENAAVIGARFLEGLTALGKKHRLIGDVRGCGLFLGIELVRDRDTLEPATQEAAAVVNRLREQGILTGTDGPLNNVIKLKPPMVITGADADFCIRVLDRILDGMA